MSLRYKGAVLSATPPTTSSSSASGMWTLQQQFQAQGNGNWPSTGTFNSDSNATNLLLAVSFTNYQSSVTGGAYVDVSPQIRTQQGLTPGTAKTWTSTGSSTITTGNKAFSQYTGCFSCNIGDGDFPLYSTGFTFNTNSALTVEFWYYASNSTGNGAVATNPFSGGYFQNWQIGINSSRQPSYFSNPGGSSTASTSLTLSAWTHIAYVFNGSGTLRIFVNGSQAYNSSYQTNTGNQFIVGASGWENGPGSGDIAGNLMQDLRVYNIQKYTGAFTVSTTNANLGGAILR